MKSLILKNKSNKAFQMNNYKSDFLGKKLFKKKFSKT